MSEKSKLRVLVVDDERDVRESLKNILERRGYEVAVAVDGEEGLKKVQELSIRIVICDIVMPKVDGVEFLKKVHQYNFSIEVIMITGHSTMERCVEAIDNGACGYLRKPFKIEDVIKSIAKAQRNIDERMEMVKEALKSKE